MRSMTGFGRGESSSADWAAVVELSAVNRKQLDIVISGPPAALAEEAAIRTAISAAVSRGRVAAKVDFSLHDGNSRGRLRFDPALARDYLSALRDFCESEGLPLQVSASDLWRAPGVFSTEDAPAEAETVRPALEEALSAALAQLLSMQESEGAHLRSDLEARVEALFEMVSEIARFAPEVAPHHRAQLLRRLAEAGLEIDLDDERVLREIALFADRSDISEELVRLESHAEQFRRYLDGSEPAGRPLDFLCQEIHRELNTIGSKASHVGIARSVVSAKAELEKVREQVQNVQ